MAWGMAAAAIGSALISANASKKGAEAAAGGADRAAEVQLKMFDTQRRDMAPWRRAGERGLEGLMTLMGIDTDGGAVAASQPPATDPETPERINNAAPPTWKAPTTSPGYGGGSIYDSPEIRPNDPSMDTGGGGAIHMAYGGVMQGQQKPNYLVGEAGTEIATDQQGNQNLVTGPTPMSPQQDTRVTPLDPQIRSSALAQSRQTASGTAPDGKTQPPPGSGLPSGSSPTGQGPYIDPATGQPTGSDEIVEQPVEQTVEPGEELTPAEEARQMLEQDPSYQFRFDEGMRSALAAGAARGYAESGREMRELTRYGQGMASTEYGNVWNRYAALSGVGQTAVQSIPYASYGAGIGNAYSNAGYARGSGYIGVGNAIQQGANQYAMWDAYSGGGSGGGFRGAEQAGG